MGGRAQATQSHSAEPEVKKWGEGWGARGKKGSLRAQSWLWGDQVKEWGGRIWETERREVLTKGL